MNHRKKVYVLTNGCPENRNDSARLEKFFKENGWTAVDDYRKADLILLNACGQEHGLDLIKELKKKKNPETELIVCGCLPKINKELLSEIYQDVTFGSDELEKVNDIFEPAHIKFQDIHANHLLPRVTSLRKKLNISTVRLRIPEIIPEAIRRIQRRKSGKTYRKMDHEINLIGKDFYIIKISNGCLNACSFCAVRLARGRLKSKPIDRIIKEFKEGLCKGYGEFGLIGTDVGCYGRDLGTNLIELLRELLKERGEYRIRLRNIQPRFMIDMLPELVEIFKSGKIPYLESAVQSGNNRILKLMRRGYTIEDYKQAIRAFKKEIPGIQVRTQVIVNFPGETYEEFQDTLRLFDELDFDFVELYIYRPRPNTEAAKMNGQIPWHIALKRYHEAYMKVVSKIESQYQEKAEVAYATPSSSTNTHLLP